MIHGLVVEIMDTENEIDSLSDW